MSEKQFKIIGIHIININLSEKGGNYLGNALVTSLWCQIVV